MSVIKIILMWILRRGKKPRYCSKCKYHELVNIHTVDRTVCMHLCHAPIKRKSWWGEDDGLECGKENKYNACKYYEDAIPF